MCGAELYRKQMAPWDDPCVAGDGNHQASRRNLGLVSLQQILPDSGWREEGSTQALEREGHVSSSPLGEGLGPKVGGRVIGDSTVGRPRPKPEAPGKDPGT